MSLAVDHQLLSGTGLCSAGGEQVVTIPSKQDGKIDLRLFAWWAGLVWLAGWITTTNWKGTPCGPSPLTKIVVFNTCHVSAKLT